jgi:glycosyltransferase involved in cell wall biosynthesis
MRVCAIIPTYNNPHTVAEVVARVRAHLDDVVVVDDGSVEPARSVVAGLAAAGRCHVVVRAHTGGKGAADKTGLAWARAHGFAYALLIDADLQHDADDIPKLLAAIRDVPEGTLVLAQPVFDDSAPRGRLRARKITKFMAVVETLGFKTGDPLCGFRVYPVEAALRTRTRGDAMDFDPEIAVRLVWQGAHIVHVPTPVVYRTGGVSHYRGVTDTILIAGAHVRLCLEGLLRLITWPVRAVFRSLWRGRRHG